MPLRRLVHAAAAVALLGGVAGAVNAPAAALNDPLFDKQWGLSTIGAPTAWNAGLFGEGVDIAILDSGLHLQHQEFTGRIAGGRNYVRPGAPPQDDQCDGEPAADGSCASGGHGTHVAGIAAAAIDNGGSVGVAPKARVLPVKVLGPDGAGTFAAAADGIRWATDNGAEVINLSLGSDIQGLSGTPSVLNDAVAYAWSKGAICVFAAGNSFVLGSGFRDQPALVVSATNRADGKPDFSSGVGEARWALSAPGGGSTVQFASDDDILSTVWAADARRDTYAEKRGTSMSAPFVAGAAAVLRGAGLTPQETVDRLLATAKDVGAPGRDSTFGAGRLDLAKAVKDLPARRTDAPPTTAAAPPVTTAPTTTAPPVSGVRPGGTERRPPGPAPTPPTVPPGPLVRPADAAVGTAAADEVVTAPEAPTDEAADLRPLDDTGIALRAPATDTVAAAGDDGVPWPWVVVAALAVLSVGSITGRQLWRRRTSPTT